MHTTAMAKTRKNATATPTAQEPLVDISEADQWRIIRESGVLNKVTSSAVPNSKEQEEENEEELLSPLTQEIFAAMALVIPFCSLLLVMEM